jgi:predicted signal transduction protein with EAL and GGDEF domain
VNNRFQAYLDSESLQEFNSFCRSVMESDVKQTAELQLNDSKRKGKAQLWVLIEARAIRNGTPNGFRMAVVDITERKRMEEELQAKTADLAKAKEAAEAGIEAGQLEMEVTESILIESMEESSKKLVELQALGVKVALDDFGTGYSSLTYLRRLPVITLKLDKSFIDGILDDLQQAEYVGVIIDLAHALNLLVVAEGVENQAQVDKLNQYDCDCIQGFVFSRPVPADEALQLLEK